MVHGEEGGSGGEGGIEVVGEVVEVLVVGGRGRMLVKREFLVKAVILWWCSSGWSPL